MIITGYIFTYLYILVVLLLAYVLIKKFKINLLIIRKIVHIMISFCFVIIYYFLKDSIHIIIVPFTMLIGNYVFYLKCKTKYDLLGIVLYPLSIFLMATVTYFEPSYYPAFAISVFILGFGDGLAPIIKQLIKSKEIYPNRTLSGCLTVFIASVIVQLICYNFFIIDINIFRIIFISFLATILEIFSQNYDNLGIPIGIFIINILLGGF